MLISGNNPSECLLALLCERLTRAETFVRRDSANQSAVQSEDEISSSDDGTEDPGIAFNKAAGEKVGQSNYLPFLSDLTLAPESQTHALARYGALRQHLRGLLLLVHTAYFWLGSCYFGVGTLPEEENKAYEDAEIVRKEVRDYFIQILTQSERLTCGPSTRSFDPSAAKLKQPSKLWSAKYRLSQSASRSPISYWRPGRHRAAFKAP